MLQRAPIPAGPSTSARSGPTCGGCSDGCPVADDVILCVSELATNAAVHSDSRRSGGTFTVRTESCPGADVRIEVEDAGGPWVSSAPDPTHGRGLDIVRTLADDWGITTTPAGRAVWARITWPASGATGLAQPDEAA